MPLSSAKSLAGLRPVGPGPVGLGPAGLPPAGPRPAGWVASPVALSAALRLPASRRPAFTLIEILIVVVILGILAAIVMPQFTSASTQGRRNTLLGVVQTLRTQVALYKLQHGDTLPDLTANGGNNWGLLTQSSTFFGQTVGPYIQTVPTSPVNSRSNVVDGTGTAPASAPCGYVYDYNGGTGTGAVWGTDIDGVTIVPQ